MAILVPSLRLLFAELDARWPNRDRRTDGWSRKGCTWPKCSSDHYPDSVGRVHAIDVDKDGIWPEWLFGALAHDHLPTNYIIWNRRIRSRSRKWKIREYTGTRNPHTDHVHVSIVHADWARNYNKGWGVARGTGGLGAAPGTEPPETSWDYYPHVINLGNVAGEIGTRMIEVSRGLRGLRG